MVNNTRRHLTQVHERHRLRARSAPFIFLPFSSFLTQMGPVPHVHSFSKSIWLPVSCCYGARGASGVCESVWAFCFFAKPAQSVSESSPLCARSSPPPLPTAREVRTRFNLEQGDKPIVQQKPPCGRVRQTFSRFATFHQPLTCWLQGDVVIWLKRAKTLEGTEVEKRLLLVEGGVEGECHPLTVYHDGWRCWFQK